MKTKLMLLFALFIGAVQAQTVTLDKFVVTATPLGELKQSVGLSAFGDNENLLNTPRSVSTLDGSFLNKVNLDSIDKIAIYTSNVQSVGSFGDSVTVNVRGDLAETYINNQRRTNNSFGFRPAFNGVEAVDVVHGAPSVVFGPGFYSGGYTNLVTKKATSEKYTDVWLQFQSLDEYGNKKIAENNDFIIDTNLPLSNNSAFRLSYETTVGRKMYEHDLFTTYNYSDGCQSFTFNFEFSRQDDPEKIGVNRVTQQLIWTGLYHSGTIQNHLDTSEIPNGPVVKLDRLAITMSDSDFAKADVVYSQAIYTNKISSDLTINNLLLGEYVDRQRFAAYEYLEYVRQKTFDNRLEVHFDKTNIYTIIGTDFRYEYREAELNYYNTFFNAWDITKGGVGDASLFPEYYPGTVGMGGKQFFGPLDLLSDTSESTLWTTSAFLQQRVKFSKFQFIYGLRADSYIAHVGDPLTKSINASARTTSESFTTSLVYNINKTLSAYITVNNTEAVNASVTGGAIVLDPNLKVNKRNFHSQNKMYEAGLRQQSGKDTLSLTGFWQYRQQHNFYTNDPDNIIVRGVELENKIQATKDLSILTNLTYMEANVDNSFPYEFNGIGLLGATGSGNYRLPGLSRVYANQTISYNLTKSVSLGTTLLWQSEQSGNALGGYHIPSQYSINGHITYTAETWSIRLSAYNLTDRKNWIHNGDFYGDNVVISRELPVRAEAALSKRF